MAKLYFLHVLYFMIKMILKLHLYLVISTKCNHNLENQ